ncbi:hypothetical protein [Actinophytocola glycyrrhizae]|uniref:Uncharacterized protein n=1 Tax=Actinophytocola glycyrrhizae TaxID=2044873 RepID=A0ABV9RY24_9PSEU
MSKTDKTRPRWVRIADTPGVTGVAVHDHRFGDCTLPDEITADSTSASHRTSGCHWHGAGYHQTGCGSAGCGREWSRFRREERRRDRHQAHRELRAYRGED